MKYLFLVFLFLASCGLKEDNQKNYHVDIQQQLIPFIETIKQKAAFYNVELPILDKPIYFETIKENWSGACDHDSGTITINPLWFENAGDHAVESVLLHEIGHCYLNRDHDNTLIVDDGIYSLRPKSLMNKSAELGGSKFRLSKYEKEYYLELFSEQ